MCHLHNTVRESEVISMIDLNLICTKMFLLSSKGVTSATNVAVNFNIDHLTSVLEKCNSVALMRQCYSTSRHMKKKQYLLQDPQPMQIAENGDMLRTPLQDESKAPVLRTNCKLSEDERRYASMR